MDSTGVTPAFTAVRSDRAYRQVVTQFQAQVRAGNLQSGDKLPPEREMAVQFGVGRNSIREAMRELDLLGLIDSRHGEGTFVAAPSAETIAKPFRAVIELSSTASESVMEFRRAVEPGVAGLAAKNITDEGVAELQVALLDFEAAVHGDRVDVREADANFHLMTGKVTGNPTVIGVHSALYSLLKDFRARLSPQSYDPTDCAVAGHRRIFDAIVAGDRNAAAQAMREHLDEVSGSLE